jgi:signal transduction histidine kinase
MCGGLFLLNGAMLLAVNYLLVTSALPPVASGTMNSDHPSVLVMPIAEVMTIDAYRQEVLRTLLTRSGFTLAVTLILALLMGWFVAHRMLRPVRAMAATARRLGADNLNQRIRLAGPRDELTELADTFDEMLDRLAAAFDSQRRFVANASHELRTPLAAQRTVVEVAMAQPDTAPAAQESYARLLAMNIRMESIIEGLLTLARSDRGLATREAVRLDEVAEQVLAGHRGALTAAGLRLQVDLRPRTVRGDRVLLERLVNNLVDNAIKFNQPGGQVWLRVSDHGCALRVTNTGPVVPSTAVDGLFEPFRQLDRDRTAARSGVGLGLSIVASIVRAHAGTVRATARPGGGLDVQIGLPDPAGEPAA